MDPEFRRTRSRQESGRRAAAEHLHRLARQLRRLDADPAAATFERVAAAAAETGEGPEARMRWRECRGRIGLDRFPGTAQDCLGDLTALGPALKTLRLLSRKGGVGKSTLAIHLAVLAQRAGLRALLLDMDPQRSAAAWWRAREAETPQLAEVAPEALRDVLDAARADGVDLAVIDTRPSVEADAVHVATLSDLILVPTRPAILDLRAILATLDVVKGAARRALIVLNACPPARGAGEAPLTGDARRALAAFGVPVAAVPITNRQVFSASLVAGLTANEVEPDGKAARETRALWSVVAKELDVEKADANRRARLQDRARVAAPTRAGRAAKAPG